MILNTGSRTDIPGFYSEWFMNRVREGFVMVRNPYRPELVTRYRFDPETIDVMVFCTKNPAPMLPYMDELMKFRLFFAVTITPYGKDIEPNVPHYSEVMESFRQLSDKIGMKRMSVRYDPIFLSPEYDMEKHLEYARLLGRELEGYTDNVVISFVDLYDKTKRNFPELKSVSFEDQMYMTGEMVKIFGEHGMTVRTCFEAKELKSTGADIGGCLTRQVLEKANDITLEVPNVKPARPGCECLLGNDIGTYNTCAHFCKYCYANYDRAEVIKNMKAHDPASPLLIGHLQDGDIVKDAVQESWIKKQVDIWDMLGDSGKI